MVHFRCRGALFVAALFALPPIARAGPTDGSIPTSSWAGYDPNREYQAGMQALDDGRYRDAKQNFEHLLLAKPHEAVGLYWLGQTDTHLGDLKGAARSYESALHADPHMVFAARELAITDEKLGQSDKAAAQLVKLQQTAAACGDTCPQAGELAVAVRDVEAALAPGGGAAGQTAQTPSR